jgi:hypothetical protein
MNEAISTPQALGHMIVGAWITQGIYAAAELGLADALAGGPRSVEELSRSSGADPDALHRLLRALASVGIFAEDGERRYALTPLAEPLRSDVPGSQRWLAMMAGAEFYRTWGELLSSVRTGQPGFDQAYGEPFFQYMTGWPERGRLYDRAMSSVHGAETAPLLDAYDFSQFRRVADLGGGNGSQLASILKRHPGLEGVLFDIPPVAQNAWEVLREAGLSKRARVLAGDFFSSVPEGCDLYVLRHVLHDWEDEQALAILRNCRAAARPEARLLIVETLIPEGNGLCFGKWLDLMMLLVGGRERTEAQYRKLLETAGFTDIRVTPTAHEVSAIEAAPAC